MTDRWGWNSTFRVLRDTEPRVVRLSLESFLADRSPEQVRAWDEEIPILQTGASHAIDSHPPAELFTAVLEYQLPLESRRPDVIFLENGTVVVVEFKGRARALPADLDQAAAYARDLGCYHRSCSDRAVHPVLVLTRAGKRKDIVNGVHVVDPTSLRPLVNELRSGVASPLSAAEFLSEDAYRPLPTLIRAARELLNSGQVWRVMRANAATEPATSTLIRVAHEAARTKTSRLVLLSGVPGSGKTLAGLRLVHAHVLDDLAVPREGVKPSAPAVFLSGNGPLVEVLQYELRGAGGGGKAFVRGVKEYVTKYLSPKSPIPPEHVLVFDEAQRAWSADKVQSKHEDAAKRGTARSEPAHFIDFAGRIPEWCVVVGLLGTGQEIYEGEEGGVVQWREAVEGAKSSRQWVVHAPPHLKQVFEGTPVTVHWEPTLNLDRELRFHLATRLERLVDLLLQNLAPEDLHPIAEELHRSGLRLYATRNLETAKAYARERYRDNKDARFGLLASSRDRALIGFGVRNTYQDSKVLKVGPWFSEGEHSPFSCRHLETVATEFQAQGLELDLALLCWGTDLRWLDGKWSIGESARYKKGTLVKDPYRLRINSYRVLLTRGRDGTVVFIPPIPGMDATYERLLAAGFQVLEV